MQVKIFVTRSKVDVNKCETKTIFMLINNMQKMIKK